MACVHVSSQACLRVRSSLCVVCRLCLFFRWACCVLRRIGMRCGHQGVEALDHLENGVRAFVFALSGVHTDVLVVHAISIVCVSSTRSVVVCGFHLCLRRCFGSVCRIVFPTVLAKCVHHCGEHSLPPWFTTCLFVCLFACRGRRVCFLFCVHSILFTSCVYGCSAKRSVCLFMNH